MAVSDYSILGLVVMYPVVCMLFLGIFWLSFVSSTNVADFIAPPTSSSYFKNQYFPFYCLASVTVLQYEWIFDGDPVTGETLDIVAHTEDNLSVLELLCSDEMNNTEVQCCYLMLDGQTYRCSAPATLRVLGPPNPVTNMNLTANATSFTLTWDHIAQEFTSVDPPDNFPLDDFNLNVNADIDTDVHYIVTINRETNHTVYNSTFTFSPMNPNPSQSFEFSVVAVNVVGEGIPCNPVTAMLEDISETSTAVPTSTNPHSETDDGNGVGVGTGVGVGIGIVIVIVIVIIIVIVIVVIGTHGPRPSKHNREIKRRMETGSTDYPSLELENGVASMNVGRVENEPRPTHQVTIEAISADQDCISSRVMVSSTQGNPIFRYSPDPETKTFINDDTEHPQEEARESVVFAIDVKTKQGRDLGEMIFVPHEPSVGLHVVTFNGLVENYSVTPQTLIDPEVKQDHDTLILPPGLCCSMLSKRVNCGNKRGVYDVYNRMMQDRADHVEEIDCVAVVDCHGPQTDVKPVKVVKQQQQQEDQT